jgi:hypothetical protein
VAGFVFCGGPYYWVGELLNKRWGAISYR